MVRESKTQKTVLSLLISAIFQNPIFSKKISDFDECKVKFIVSLSFSTLPKSNGSQAAYA